MKRLLLVDPVAHTRDSLATFLGLQEDLEVIGQTADAAGAIYLARQYQPDVVFMDTNLPDGDGFTVTRQLLALDAPPEVILLTIHRNLQDLHQAEEAGAMACIEKSAGVDAILEALHRRSP